MNIFNKLGAALFFVVFIAACGGGSNNGSGPGSVITPNTTTDTVISGMATVGPVSGTVSFYTVNSDGAKGSLLKNSPVVFGRYSANIGRYAGPVVIEVTGSYTDEATGAENTPLTTPLRAALPHATGAVKAAVTPLTELALRKAGALTKANIDAGNKLVSDIFKFNVIDTQPVAPTTAAVSKANQSQKDYTLALAALSQLSLMRGGEPLTSTLAHVANGVSFNGMTSQVTTNFQEAVTGFIASGNNLTGITNMAATNLARIDGGATITYTLALQGNSTAKAVKGIQFELVLPDGLKVRSDPGTGLPFAGIVTASGAVSSAVSRYSAADGLLYLGFLADGIGSGDLVTVICDIVTGVSGNATPATLPYVRNLKADGGVVDGSSVTVSGVSVTVR
jgi:hypothetical protein